MSDSNAETKPTSSIVDLPSPSGMPPSNEKISRLDGLVTRLRMEIPSAVTHPVIPFEAYANFNWLSIGMRQTENFARASVAIPFVDIDTLTPDEFRDLQQALQSLVMSAYTTAGISVPHDLQERIDLESKTNILRHETDHLRAITDDTVRQSARVVIAFTNEDYEGVFATDVAGVALKKDDLLDPRDRLRTTLAPEILSPIDIATARHLASEIGDIALIEWVEQEILKRGFT